MQPTLQPAETHDAIVALLRDHPPRPARDPSELNIVPGHEEPVAAAAPEVTTAPVAEAEPEPVIEAAPAVAPAMVTPAHQEPAFEPIPPAPAFEPIPPAPAAEPIMLAPPLEPALRTSPLSDIKMDAELHRPPARAGRGLLRFVTMVFVGIGATIAWQVYGETAKERFTELAPQLLAAGPASAEQTNATEPQAAAQPASTQAAAPEAAPAQAAAVPATPAAPAAPAQAAAAAPPPAPPAARPADTAQTQAALLSDATQKMEAMSREIASLKQTVEQLKASQLQMNHDLARTMEQQMKRKLPTQPKQTSTPLSQRSADSPPPPSAPPPVQRASASPPPPPPQNQNYGQLQTYGQSRVYDPPPQTYGRTYNEPYGRPYGRTYDSADADRDVYAAPPPPPSPNYQPGYSTVPRPPMPMQ